MWAPTVLYVVVLRKTGAVDWHTVGSSYLGLFGVGAAYLALGTLMSSMAKSQLVALLLAIFAEFGLFVLGVGEYVFEPGLLRDVCAHLSMGSQMEEMARGTIALARKNFGEENPVAEFTADEIGVLADEADSGALGEIAFQDGASIHVPE